MKIILKNVIPSALKASDLSNSEVWSTDLIIENLHSYFVSSNSGKGKSTLLNFIFGLRNDYEGLITFDGRDIKSFNATDWANLRKNRIAYLTQDLKLINHLSVWENLIIKNTLTNHYSEEEIKTLVKQFDLLDHLEKSVSQLSIGQQQRIALIRTILQPFEILLLDEPFSHIDEENIKIALEIINTSCKRENAFYVLATLGYDYGIKENKLLQL